MMTEILEAGWLNKTSCFAPALGVTKFIIVTKMNLVTLFVLLKSDLDVQQTNVIRGTNTPQSNYLSAQEESIPTSFQKPF